MAYKIQLQYNSETFSLQRGDIPGLEGKGIIIVENHEGVQYQSTQGNFNGLSASQVNGVSRINGVDIGKLVESLRARR